MKDKQPKKYNNQIIFGNMNQNNELLVTIKQEDYLVSIEQIKSIITFLQEKINNV